MRSIVRFLIWILILAGSVVGLARATAIRWWQVPMDDPWLGASVAPTLRPGDWVILWRLTRATDGDLVLCPEPKAPERVVLGRILGSANDQLRFDKGQLERNGHTLARERSCSSFEVTDPKTNRLVTLGCTVDDLEGRLFQRGNLSSDLPAVPSMAQLTVEPGQYFLVSDNRQFPFDSRDFGPVDASSCKETVVYRLWGKGGYFDPSGRFELAR